MKNLSIFLKIIFVANNISGIVKYKYGGGVMYLNTQDGYENFKMLVANKIFVDKSMILEELNEIIDTTDRFICITRPRRFGKSQMTFLIESYYSQAVESKHIFDALKFSKAKTYPKYINKFNTVKIDFSLNDTNLTYEQYISRIENGLINNLKDKFVNIDFEKHEMLADKFNATKEKFVFIFDEWDYIFNKRIYPDNHDNFLDFLRNLIKDKSYISLCYMTGILPIKKHSSGSALNVFEEYTLLDDGVFENYFGFTM